MGGVTEDRVIQYSARTDESRPPRVLDGTAPWRARSMRPARAVVRQRLERRREYVDSDSSLLDPHLGVAKRPVHPSVHYLEAGIP